MSATPTPTFCVIYRWRLHPGREATFERCWRRLTEAIRAERGGLGSRLHRADDGSWIAYAQWPDEAAWLASRERPSADAEASLLMGECIAVSDEPVRLQLVADALSPAGDGGPG